MNIVRMLFNTKFEIVSNKNLTNCLDAKARSWSLKVQNFWSKKFKIIAIKKAKFIENQYGRLNTPLKRNSNIKSTIATTAPAIILFKNRRSLRSIIMLIFVL